MQSVIGNSDNSLPVVSQAGYEPGSHTSNFSNTPLPASNNFWKKVQLSTKQDACLATSILLSLPTAQHFFQPTAQHF